MQKPKPPAASQAETAPSAPAASASGALPASWGPDSEAKIIAALRDVPCSWLSLKPVARGGAPSSLDIDGVARSPAETQQAITRAAAAAGVPGVGVVQNVGPIGPQSCAVLDVLRGFRADERAVVHVQSEQPEFKIQPQPEGDVFARTVTRLELPSPDARFALLGIEENGDVTFVTDKLSDLDKVAGQSGSYTLQLQAKDAGWKGTILVLGQDVGRAKLLESKATGRGPEWADKVKAAAAAGAWKSEVAWFRVIG
jgi:hypothetical protein